MTMFKIISWCVKAGVAAIVSLVILSLFTLVYSYSGVHITNETGATDYKWESNQYKSIMNEGFSWMKMNADGFNNSFNLADTDHVNILLMGSSHMEAVNVPGNTNVGYLLNNKELSEFVTYNIGISGHTIYQCVNNLSNAVKFYNPSSYIIIETDRISLDEEKMREVIDGCFPVIPSYDSGLMYTLQKYIPCLLPFYRELGNWIAMDNSQAEVKSVEEEKNKDYSESYIILLNSFFDKLVNSADSRKVIILYHPEMILDDEGLLKSENKESVEIFQKVCSEHGIAFVDMYNDFCREYTENHKMAYGFINTKVGVGHLNETGHRLIAERLGAVIKELKDGTE